MERYVWNDVDVGRPLTDLGGAQALSLAELDVVLRSDIRSSAATRCKRTVTPLADRHGVDVVVDARLAEGADPGQVVEWVTTAIDEDLVLCGHGDMIPYVLRLLTTREMTLDGPNACQKASVWTCVFDGEQPQHASYRPPPLVE